MTEELTNSLVTSIVEAMIKSHENGEDESEDTIQRVKTTFTELINTQFGTPVLPAERESSAITIENPKTAALAYDRIWSMPSITDGPPAGISFYGASPVEVAWGLFAATASGNGNDGIGHVAHEVVGQTAIQWAFDKKILDLKDPFDGRNVARSSPDDLVGDFIAAQASRAIREKYGFSPIPIFSSRHIMKRNFAPGPEDAILFVLGNIPVVCESDLEWKQIMEFRADRDIRIKYMRMLKWMREAVKNGTPDEMLDDFEIRLYDYKAAIKKHSLKNTLGALSCIMNWKVIGTYSVAALTLNQFLDTIGVALGAAALSASKVAVSIAQERLDYEDLRQGKEWEVAYCYEAEKQLGSK